jgi:hypothetical protein
VDQNVVADTGDVTAATILDHEVSVRYPAAEGHGIDRTEPKREFGDAGSCGFGSGISDHPRALPEWRRGAARRERGSCVPERSS